MCAENLSKKKINLVAVIILFIFNGLVDLQAQVKFVEGYIIGLDGQKKQVLIKDLAWNNNPDSFQYKVSSNSDIIEGGVENVDEFGIGNTFKYKRASVQIDQSMSQTSRMTYSPEPEFRRETVFLKQLVGGEANLYVFQNSKFQRFFIQLEGQDIEPLVYKQYIVNQNQIKVNTSYKKVLYDKLKNETITSVRIRSVQYDAENLIALLTEYNASVSAETTVYKRSNSNGKFSFGVKLGYFATSLDVKQEGTGIINTDVRSVNIGKDSGLRIAVEVEYVLPFNKNKWALFMEPGYQSFKGEGDIEIETQNPNFEERLVVEYNYIDVPFGLKYYMFLNDKNTIFLNAAFLFSFDLEGTFDYTNPTFNQRDPSINSSANLAFGIGYKYNQKFGIEGRVNTARNITRDEAYLNSNFGSIGVLISYYFL